MNRRRFIGVSALAILLAGVTAWFVVRRRARIIERSLEPSSLSKICSKDKLLEFGSKYRQMSGEDNEELLNNYLLKDFRGSDKERSAYLDQLVSADFRENRTIMIDGWLLSITEARQCALYSLKESPKK